jgi:peptidoglycan/LPS O-acetylase OafA/YrhL
MYRPLPQHLPALDGLRGVAALSVLVSHCANEGWLPGLLGNGFGQIGVALFYVLSGFLMLHFAVAQPFDRAALRRYAVARAARVLPLYFAALAVTAAVFAVLGASFFGTVHWSQIVLSALLLKGAGVLWSVPVEVHFYLLFPLLWWAHRSRRPEHFVVLCLAMLVGCAALAMFGTRSDKVPFLPYWLHFFVLGCLVRWLLDDGMRNRLPVTGSGFFTVSVWAAFILLALTPPELRVALGLPRFSQRFDPLAIVLLPVVLWFAAAQAGPFRLFALPMLRWLGTVSFGVYLLHSPVIALLVFSRLDYTFGPVLSFAVVLSASISGAALAHRLIERPAQLALRSRYASPSIAAQA